AGAGMRSDAEGEDPSLSSEQIESLRGRIDRRIVVGGGQNDEYHVARPHLLVRDKSILSQEAACVLDGRVVSQDLTYNGQKQARIRYDPFKYLRARSQGEERIADQSRRRLVSLREKPDTVSDNDIYFFAPDAVRRSRESAQQTTFLRQESLKHPAQIARRSLAAIDLIGRAGRSEAASKIIHPRSGLIEHVRCKAEQTSNNIDG